MARVTVEDCLDKVENRFYLVMHAAERARLLATTGTEPNVEWDNDKPTVVALREIADGYFQDGKFADKHADDMIEAEHGAEEDTAAE